MKIFKDRKSEKSNSYQNDIAIIRRCLRTFDIKIHHLLIPMSLSMIVALFDGASIGLLIPLLKGAIDQNFDFVIDLPVLKYIFSMLPSSTEAIFIALILTIFITTFFNQFFTYIVHLKISYVTLDVNHKIRKKILARLLQLGKLFFDQNNSRYLGSTIDFGQQITSMYSSLNYLFLDIMIFSVYFIMLMFISWELTIFVILFVPLSQAVYRKFIAGIYRFSQQQVLTQKEIDKHLSNILGGISLVKAYARESREEEEFDRLGSLVKDRQKNETKINSAINPLQRILMIATLMIIVFFLAFIKQYRQIDLPQILVFFYLLRECLNKIPSFGNFRITLARFSGPVKEIMSLFSEDKPLVRGGDMLYHGFLEKIEIKNLNFSYTPDRMILENLSFTIKKGYVTAIVGETGAGKTTLVHLLMRFYDCPAGTIFIDGTDIREFSLPSLLQQIAFVSQDSVLFHESLRFNICYGSDNISEEEFLNALRKARLDELVRGLPQGVDTIVGDRGIKLSGGEKQRVAIARAMLKVADILILDEATSSLDTTTEKQVQEAIEEIVHGKTCIVIAHRLATIRNADQIIVLEDGKLVEQGELHELVDMKGKFYQYWRQSLPRTVKAMETS